MASLDSSLTPVDIETLLEAMTDWEILGTQEFHLLNMVKNSPLPPEDHEAFEHMRGIKEHFRQREREIIINKQVKQEKAVFLKAKLLLLKRDLGIDQLFESAPQQKVVTEAPESNGDGVKIPISGNDQKLEWAEFFIRDLGVWEHYQKFLAEKSA